MIFDPSTSSHLKPWLVRTLEPICDAEPGALADYILALLKHNVPEGEMRKELVVQLDEFLEKECASFIDTLFTVLRTQSYLPYTSASPSSPTFGPKNPDNGIPIPLDGLLSPSLSQTPDRTLKRSMENDERDGRPPAKGPRLSTEGQFSRYSTGQGGRPENRSTGSWGGRGDRHNMNGYRDGMDIYGIGMPMPGAMIPGINAPMHQLNGRRPQVYQPPDQKRGICRDYHNNGYCARGAMCKYSHAEDAVVPGIYSLNAAMSVPFMPMPMFPGPGHPFGIGGGLSAAYDPHEARMDMRPMPGRHQRAPLLPRIQQEDGSQVIQTTTASGELPVIQDLTPIIRSTDKSHPSAPSHPDPQNQPLQQEQQPLMQSERYNGSTLDSAHHGGMNGHPYIPVAMNSSMDIDMSPPVDVGPPKPHSLRPARGNSRGGGTFGGEVHNFRPERRSDKTLVVEKIPEDKLTLECVNEWFKRFGTVTNVAIDSMNAKALISFSNHDEAYAAWKSEDAVFNNRFVKLFWHRPMEGHGQVGARLLAASAPLVANISVKEPNPRPTATPLKPTSSRKSLTSATASVLAAKQQLLEQQIAEQKSLMASLDTAAPEEKKKIMTRLRKLGEEMKPTAPTEGAMANASNDDERKERERLDKELEMHHATAAVEGEESTDDLKAKLNRLRAEAVSLGIPELTAEPTYGGGYRPYRGRVRGTRIYRGALRGGPPRTSMKLDNRPKKLLVKGVQEEGVQSLHDWFETTGQMETLETLESGDIVVTFKSRAAAEQGLSKGNNVPTIGSVQITWYTGKPSVGTALPKQAPPKASPPNTPMVTSKETDRVHSPEPVHSPRGQEEEVIASGWGGDGDGEDGMGML